jgi:hypothetical protein
MGFLGIFFLTGFQKQKAAHRSDGGGNVPGRLKAPPAGG